MSDMCSEIPNPEEWANVDKALAELGIDIVESLSDPMIRALANRWIEADIIEQ
jgi:hypothetical protein